MTRTDFAARVLACERRLYRVARTLLIAIPRNVTTATLTKVV